MPASSRAASFPTASTKTRRKPSRRCSPTCARRDATAKCAHASLDGSRELLVSASVFREKRATLLLVRATPMDADRLAEVVPGATARYVDFVAAAPDGFVVTDSEGKVLAANPAFLDFAQLPGEEQARGESLETWLGRPGVDLSVLLRAAARTRVGAPVRHDLARASGTTSEVELSGAALPDSEPPCFGFTVRDVGSSDVALLTGRRRRCPDPSNSSPNSSAGSRSRASSVRPATLSSACASRLRSNLPMTIAPRPLEMLGLSRQSLYVKLHRYGLGDLSDIADSKGDIQA